MDKQDQENNLIKGGQRLGSLDDQMQGIQRDISPVQDVEPPTTGERKVTDARAFLQTRREILLRTADMNVKLKKQ